MRQLLAGLFVYAVLAMLARPASSATQQPFIRVEGCYVNRESRTIYVVVNSNTAGHVEVNLVAGVQYVGSFEEKGSFRVEFNVNPGGRRVVLRDESIPRLVALDDQRLLQCRISSAVSTPYDTASLLMKHRRASHPWTLAIGAFSAVQYQTIDECLRALQSKAGEYVVTPYGAEQMDYTSPFFVCR